MIEELILEIYRELYKNSNPPRDYDQMVAYHEGTNIPFWLDLCIPEQKSNEIIENALKGKKLTKIAKNKIINTIMLGVSPKFCN
jgi:hypothetical protein